MRRSCVLLVFVLSLTLLSVCFVSASSVILDYQNVGVPQDTYVSSSSPDSNFGTGTAAFVNNGTTDERLSLFQVNFSILPSDAVVTGAVFRPFLNDNSLDVSESWTLNVYHVFSTFDFNETNITYNTLPNSSFINATPLYSEQYVDSTPFNRFLSVNITDKLVSQRGLGYENVTLLFLANNRSGSPTTNDRLSFRTREWSTPAQRPFANVTYRFPSSLTVQVNDTATGLLINGLCVNISNSTFSELQCNSTGNMTTFSDLLQTDYNITAYSIGVGDGINSNYNRQVLLDYSLDDDQTLIFNASRLRINIDFLDELNRSVLAPNTVFVSVIDSEDIITNLNTSTGNLTIEASFPTGDYTLRYFADGFSLRDFLFTFNDSSPDTNLTLYLISESVFSSGVVEVKTPGGLAVEGAEVILKRYYGPATIPNVVQQGLTNDLGQLAMVAEVITASYFWEVRVGGVLRFSSPNPETLTLGSDGLWHRVLVLDIVTVDLANQNSGFSYSFAPTNGTLRNATGYTFTVTINSSFWDVTGCTYSLVNTSDDSVLNTTTGFCGLTGGTTTLRLFTGESGEQVRGTLTVETSEFTNTYGRLWRIRDIFTTGFTLRDAFDDISNFDKSGFGGFARMFIALIVIIGLPLWVGSRVDLISSPEQVLFFMFALSLVFSYLGWLRLDIDTIPFESLKQYFISMLLGIATGLGALRKWGAV